MPDLLHDLAAFVAAILFASGLALLSWGLEPAAQQYHVEQPQ